MARYKIWQKTEDVITPIGEVLSPEQWIERYPVAKVLKTVCGGGEINGSFFGLFEEMKDLYERNGLDFDDCETDQDYLDLIEAFEDLNNMPEEVDEDYVSPEERIASALEFQAMLMMPSEDDEVFDDFEE